MGAVVSSFLPFYLPYTLPYFTTSPQTLKHLVGAELERYCSRALQKRAKWLVTVFVRSPSFCLPLPYERLLLSIARASLRREVNRISLYDSRKGHEKSIMMSNHVYGWKQVGIVGTMSIFD